MNEYGSIGVLQIYLNFLCESRHVLSPEQYSACNSFQQLINRDRLQSSTNQLSISLGAKRLGSLNWSADSTVDDQLGQDTKRTGNTE